MGKRKSSSKPQGPKKKDPLPELFPCLFCNHEDAVKPKVDKKSGVGNLSCKVCGQTFQCSINYLSAPVDVYSEWVDAADHVSSKQKAVASGLSQGLVTRRMERPIEERDDEGIVADDDEY
ncbi:transcription elongation factor 1 [Verticillium alfalfae VaMs.102]|uniref:Transcription elongation factor 1 homolog n=1 Tax=Verticillium alfalfae (strain VaMs.102 / ATCC MYA-4576 / FGSC 10136) TaxID=526221 RepID=C9S890_VERA1|nr:transcription elongation factor 1 [Verticillium alfalfae VaMs.102]EEY13900.1 transcription elongation factor 1 [Verticillium alfalfae VaMs.102]